MTPSQATPRVDALLQRMRGRIVSMIWLHGLGSVAAVAGAWLLFHFLLDWLLHVPAPVRILHTTLLVVLPAFVLVRELVLRLKRVPERADLALIAERADPEARELLVSAVQLAPTLEASSTAVDPESESHPASARALVRRVIEGAEERAPMVPIEEVVSSKLPLRRFVIGAVVATAAAVVLLRTPQLSSIFFQRMLGRNVAWPQRTHLAIEIPDVGNGLMVSYPEEGRIHVRMARGSDVPVVVRAEGVVPDEITLHSSAGPDSVLPSGGNPLFRTRLRALQEDVSFWVTGGDDRRGLPVVDVEVLQPPDVAGLALEITPPEYTGLPARLVHDRDVEVLKGSELTIHVLPDPPEARGIARLLPADRTLELEPLPFPIDPAVSTETQEASPGLAFRLVAEESFRYRFELEDQSGLQNPDPGLFGVRVNEDRRPEVTLLAPGRVEVNVVPGGSLPLHVRVSDDFGLASLGWSVRQAVGEEQEIARGELELRPGGAQGDTEAEEGDAGPAAGDTPPRQGLAWRRLEVSDWVGPSADPTAEGTSLVLQVEATDNRRPEAGRSPSPPVRIHVVGADEFMRRLQDDLARVGEEVRRTGDLIDAKLMRTRELVAALASDDPQAAGATELAAAQSSARRIEGDSRALGRELASITQSLLDSRLDERAGALLEALDQALSSSTDKSFRPQPWRDLAARHARGELGKADLAAELVEMVGIALEVSEEHARGASAAMDRARAAGGPVARREALVEAESHQGRAKERIDDLLVALAEWDDFQSVLGNLRDILNGQKNLMERTRQFAKEN